MVFYDVLTFVVIMASCIHCVDHPTVSCANAIDSTFASIVPIHARIHCSLSNIVETKYVQKQRQMYVRTQTGLGGQWSIDGTHLEVSI